MPGARDSYHCPGRRAGRPAAIAAIGSTAIGIAAVTGCSPAQQPAAGSPATSAPATTPATTPATAVVPATLGRPAGVFAHGTGFGQVKPTTIFNGGDPTGRVTHIVWASWGGPRAVASGKSDYVGPGQSVATGTQETATIVAFNLGTCDGKLMYQAVEWYFPEHHQAFDAGQYENICTGTYVPGS